MFKLHFLRECFNLIELGVCTAEDIDIAVRGSMGFKWAFCGPMESQDLAGLQTTAAMVYNIEQDLSNTRELPQFLTRNGRKRTAWNPFKQRFLRI